MIIFKGDTREIRVTIEQNEVQIDPEAALTGCKAWIFHVASGEIVGKWSLVAETGFEEMTVTDDDKLLFCLTQAMTEAAEVGQVIIQVSFTYADIHAPDGKHRITKKGILGYIRDAKY
jgi:hypothetical protein